MKVWKNMATFSPSPRGMALLMQQKVEDTSSQGEAVALQEDITLVKTKSTL